MSNSTYKTGQPGFNKLQIRNLATHWKLIPLTSINTTITDLP